MPGSTDLGVSCLQRGHGAELGRLVRGRETVSKDDLIAAIARPEFRGEDAAPAALEAWTRRGGPSGPENGYARTGGVFRIPLASFGDAFTFLAVEEG
jgi:hypothetical protein